MGLALPEKDPVSKIHLRKASRWLVASYTTATTALLADWYSHIDDVELIPYQGVLVFKGIAVAAWVFTLWSVLSYYKDGTDTMPRRSKGETCVILTFLLMLVPLISFALLIVGTIKVQTGGIAL